MPQITIYLPRDIAEQVKKKAKSLSKSLSSYFTELAKKDARPTKWPKKFINLYGSAQIEPAEIKDLRLEEREKI